MLVSGWIDLGLSGSVITDLTVAYYDTEQSPIVEGFFTDTDGLDIEYASIHVRTVLGGSGTPVPDTTFRITGIPDSLTGRSFRVWETATPSNDAVFDIPGVKPELDDVKGTVDALLALFQAEAGTHPVTFTFVDQLSAPIAGIQISVWDDGLTIPLVPNVLTNTSGGATVALPPGDYKAFYFKEHTSFDSAQPVSFTVVDSPISIAETVNTQFPSMPTLPRITFYGWIKQLDLSPVENSEIEMTIHETPQLIRGIGLSRYKMTAKSDSAGYFEMYPVAGATVTVTEASTGYERTGRLPLSGSLNWVDFNVAEE